MVPKKVCPSCGKKKLYFDHIDLVCQDCYDEQMFKHAVADWSPTTYSILKAYFRSRHKHGT